MKNKSEFGSAGELFRAIRVARGEEIADTVIKNVKYLDVYGGEFLQGDVAFCSGKIVGTGESYQGKQVIDAQGAFLVPGFIDTHVHLESSLMTPARFQESVLPCGTTTAIWDPHEIANVKGVKGIQWALDASENLLLDVRVMVPSCVPSTTPSMGLESSGAELKSADLLPFQRHERVLGLAEMMNFPGLLFGDVDVLEKLVAFQHSPRDGHCPGLTGKDLNAYAAAGIHSCHESTTLLEAREKMTKGIHVLIREGSCAKDADTLLPLLNDYTSSVLGFCTDDRNPADIAAEGHVSCIVNRALRRGHSPETVFRAASFGPSKIYGLLDRGALTPGLLADAVLVAPADGGDWKSGFKILDVWKSGVRVEVQALKKTSEDRKGRPDWPRNLNIKALKEDAFDIPSASKKVTAKVIGVRPRQIITDHQNLEVSVTDGMVQVDTTRDILKISVIERHRGSGRQTTALVTGFGLSEGAIATSINHDSHNIIVVGASDDAMLAAVQRLTEIDGGIVVYRNSTQVQSLALPIAGLMTDESPEVVTAALHRLKALATEMGCRLEEPFLQLSFLALPVIPSLKITDRGLVDVTQFKIVPLIEN